MRIEIQIDIVKDIIEGLETNMYGRVIRERCDIRYNLNPQKSFIEFTVKNGHKVNDLEWFYLGYFLGR